MGKSMNLNNLSPEEAQQILQVIQKDFELRQKERERLSKIEEVINEEDNKTEVLTKQQKFNETCCIRCCQSFGFIFNRKQTCQQCKLFVCKSCANYDDGIKGYVCKACLKEADLKHKSFDWFYNDVSKKYKRFGSAKVVRTLYRHSDGSRSSKFHWSDGDEAIMEEPENFEELIDTAQADNESDSGYDPSIYSSSFGLSGSLRTKRRPSLKSVFPEIKIRDANGHGKACND